MSRELKFRVWSYEDKEYRTDCNLTQVFNSMTGMPAIVYSDEGDRFDIEQYTGLKDKNGKEIYEGDIVKITSYSFFEPDIGIVGFNESRGLYDTYTIENNRTYWTTGSCFCSLMSREDYTTEVIGDIHENPELLGDEDDDEPTNAEINDLTDIGYGG